MISIASNFFFSAKAQIKLLVGVAERGKSVTGRHHICQFFTPALFQNLENLPQKKRVNRNILNPTTRILQDQSFFFFCSFSVTLKGPPSISGTKRALFDMPNSN